MWVPVAVWHVRLQTAISIVWLYFTLLSCALSMVCAAFSTSRRWVSMSSLHSATADWIVPWSAIDDNRTIHGYEPSSRTGTHRRTWTTPHHTDDGHSLFVSKRQSTGRFRTCTNIVLTCTNGVSPNYLPVIVASDRPWTTVDTCPLTTSEGRLNLFHEVDDDAVIWLQSTVTAALAK